jgi:hypothetical protein
MRKPPLLVDGRNALNPEEIKAAGIRYRGFGHGDARDVFAFRKGRASGISYAGFGSG